MKISLAVPAVLSAAALVISACGGSDDDGGGGGGSDTLRVGVQALPPGQGNPFSALGSPSIYTWAAMFDGLTQVNSNGEAKPALATKWESTSPTEWTFTLREGLTFSNGEKLDSAAVVSTFAYLHSDEGKDTVVGKELLKITSAVTNDDLSLTFTTAKPDPTLPNTIASMYIVAPKAWQDLGPDGFAAKPVGSGPFKVDSWDPGKVTFSAFTGSWRKPKVTKLVVTELAEPASRVQALQSDQVDLALGLAPDQIATIEGSGDKVQISPAPQVMSLAFIGTKKDSPLADQKVRQALNYAVDKQSIVDNLLAGEAKPAGQGATPAAFGYDPDLEPYPYDTAEAEKLLGEAGYGDGFKLTAEVVTGTFPADAEIYQAMKADLAKVKVDVTLKQIKFSEWLDKYISGSWTVDAFGLSWNTVPALDARRPYGFFSCEKKPAFFCDESVMPLLDKADQELEPDKRKQALHDLAQKVHDNPPALFLVEQIDLNGTAGNLSGYRNDNRFLAYHEMSLGS